MLNLNRVQTISFKSAKTNSVQEAVPETKKIRNNAYSNGAESLKHSNDAFQEGFFRYQHLINSRPVMLSHTSTDYNEWLSQFDTEEERNLVLKILQNYTYIDLNNARKAFNKLHTELESEIDINKTKFATLGTAKSGSMMGYLYRQANKMRSKGTVHHQFTDKTNIPKNEQFLTSTQLQDPKFNKDLAQKGFENIVIVDDMIGDGDSFIEYLTPDLVDSLKQYKNIYYLTLIKDPDGEKNVHEKFPDLNIKFKTAKEVYKYDSPENTTFSDEEKSKIDRLVLKYGNRIEPSLVGKYARSKLFVSFDWNTPGNTPMIFNYSTNNWNALFERFNGLETKSVGTNFDFCC